VHVDDRHAAEQAEPCADPLPEHKDYHDEGCDLFPSCLECPLSRCRYDDQAEGMRPARILRDEEVMRERRETGRGVSELARIFGLSTRTVQRIIRRSSDE